VSESNNLSESSEWDAAVLGEHYQLVDLLSGSEVGHSFPETRLTPLQQVLLINALPRGGNQPLALRAIPSVNSLIRNAMLLRSMGEQTYLPLQESGEEFTWSPLSTFHLRSLSGAFHENVSVLLHQSGAAKLLQSAQRTVLNSLIFHPLQNARDHGIVNDPRGFSGISFRIVDRLEPETKAVRTYLNNISGTSVDVRSFLEIVIHDDGLGIANHFYRSKSMPDAPDLFTRPITVEWSRLNQAFERHATSKYFAAVTTRLEAPGIGLAALMSSLKRLNVFMELRTGRLRVYRWFMEEEIIPRESMLMPASVAEELPVISGTIFRFFVPLFESPHA
jgi:hypothetical protein